MSIQPAHHLPGASTVQCAALVCALGVGSSAAVADFRTGLYDLSPLGSANVVQGATARAFEVSNLGSSGMDGVAARRIAIGEEGVKPHATNLRVGWPDPFGVEVGPDAMIQTSLVADLNPDGVGDPVRASTVGWTHLGEGGGVNRYGFSFDFSSLGATTGTLRVRSGETIVTEFAGFGSGQSLALDGLPPGEPVVIHTKEIATIAVDWIDDDSDGDDVFDVDAITVSGLPGGFTGFTLPDGSHFDAAATTLELMLDGPETELAGVFGFDFVGSGLNSFTLNSVPTPGTVVCLGLAAATASMRRRRPAVRT